ncbi:MAG: hypothetical protein IT366_05265 [Candidatus Hydrogenedentes bacterium]|nr:hypothetical protein [Candidatus Hydrogenedentota bacterium]
MNIKNTGFWRIAALVAVLAFLVACPRHRPLRIIYNQSDRGNAANYSELYYSDFFGGVLQIADDFELAEDQNIVTRVRWWGVYRDDIPVADEFTVFVYEIYDPGEPQTHPWYEYTSTEVERTVTTQTITWGLDTLNVYEYDLDIDDVELDCDRTYALSIVNDTGRWAWLVNGSSSQGNDFGWSRSERWGDWSVNAIDSAFVLWSDR